MNTSLETMDDQALLERKALLLRMLESASTQEENVGVKEPEIIPDREVSNMSADEVVQTVHIGNRMNLATTSLHDFRTLFFQKGNLPEYQRLLDEYQSALDDALNADTLTSELVMAADEARRSLNRFRNRVSVAKKAVTTAQNQFYEAQRALAEEMERLSTAKKDYEGAQLKVIETIRKSEEANSRADSAAFRSIALANKANRYLLDQEIIEAERAMAESTGKANVLAGNFSTLKELETAKHAFKVQFVFRTESELARRQAAVSVTAPDVSASTTEVPANEPAVAEVTHEESIFTEGDGFAEITEDAAPAEAQVAPQKVRRGRCKSFSLKKMGLAMAAIAGVWFFLGQGHSERPGHEDAEHSTADAFTPRAVTQGPIPVPVQKPMSSTSVVSVLVAPVQPPVSKAVEVKPPLKQVTVQKAMVVKPVSAAPKTPVVELEAPSPYVKRQAAVHHALTFVAKSAIQKPAVKVAVIQEPVQVVKMALVQPGDDDEISRLEPTEEVSINKVVDQFVTNGQEIALLKEQLDESQKALRALSDKVSTLLDSTPP